MLDQILTWIEPHAPLRLVGLLICCSLGFPFSKGLALILAGIIAYRGAYSLPVMVLFGGLGLHLGDSIFFTVGKRWGNLIFQWRVFKRLVKPQSLKKGIDMVAEHGPMTLVMARLTPFVRTACYITLGSLNMQNRMFHSVNVLVCSLYSAVFVLLGYFLGPQVQNLNALGMKGNLLVSVLMLAVIVIPLFQWLRKKPEPTIEIPLPPTK